MFFVFKLNQNLYLLFSDENESDHRNVKASPNLDVYYIFSHAFVELCYFVGRAGFQVPLLHYPENISSELLLLNKEYAWHIGGGFSQHDVQEWRLLYHSSLHGQSFSTFLGNVT
jgi:hypothetical protein